MLIRHHNTAGFAGCTGATVSIEYFEDHMLRLNVIMIVLRAL